MLQVGEQGPEFSLPRLDGLDWNFNREAIGKRTLLIFFETDCPTCRLTIPYLNHLARDLKSGAVNIIGISQDGGRPTRDLVEQMEMNFPVLLDGNLEISRLYDPVAVPTL